MTGGVLLANLNLLFWLSLLPFTTGWMGENHFSRDTVALYGANLLLSALSYYVLQGRIVAIHDKQAGFGSVIGRDLKGKGSLIAYILGIAAALAGAPMISFSILSAVAIMWLVPDRRMERVIATRTDHI